MSEGRESASEHHAYATASPREVLAVGFRQRRLIVVSFLGIFTAIALATILWPWPYLSEMKILVRQERVNPLVSSEEMPPQMVFQGVTEQDLNSEVELLRSRDLLERVVVKTGLHERPGRWMTLLKDRLVGGASNSKSAARQVARSTLALQSDLSIDPIQKTSLISVSYTSTDPELTARVLRTLADLYLEKHLEVHRPVGVFDFFEQETERYRKELDAAKARVAAFGQSEGVISPSMERDAALGQVTDLTQKLRETEAELASARERVRVLDSLLAATPARITTESREASARLQELQKGKLLELELKHSELNRVYQPNYPLVVEVEQQLAITRDAIARAEQSPLREQATDVNPTYEWMTTELARARSELAAQEARRATLDGILRSSRDRALTLDRLTLESHELQRDLKVAEENYVTYHRKREEARISNALDTRRIVNVAVAESAAVPIKPARPRRLLMLLLAGVAAVVGSLGLAFVVDVLDPSFRTPREVRAYLNAPVLASFPRNGA